MLNLSRFERYRELIDDWDAFSDALHRPLPACMWTNTLRTTPRVLSEWLERCGVAHAPLSWLPEAFVIHDPEHAHALGATFPYLAGLGHVQEEVSLIPSFLLGATRGERVLDTCAAPGGKTVHIAIQMDNAGTVVANDKSYQRLRAVRSISNRLGVFNIAMTNIDACNMPNAMGRFDRALVDVPCSCEGTSRKNHGVLEDQTNPEVFARVQRRILARALKLLRPGGRLVYSTCTYAPEENELVLQRVLSEFGWERARIISPDRELAGLRLTPGLTTWRGEELHPDMARTLRVWPHHNDTGGFFVAVLERVLDDDHAQVIERAFDPHTHDAHLEPEAEHWEKVRQWFGLGDRWEGARRIYRSNTRLLSLVHTPHEPPTKPAPLSMGMPFLRTNMAFPKLTTSAAMVVGPLAKRNVVDVDAAQANAYLRRTSFRPEPSQLERCAPKGYVVVRHEGFALGLGMRRPGAGEGLDTVESLFPKALKTRGARDALPDAGEE